MNTKFVHIRGADGKCTQMITNLPCLPISALSGCLWHVDDAVTTSALGIGVASTTHAGWEDTPYAGIVLV